MRTIINILIERPLSRPCPATTRRLRPPLARGRTERQGWRGGLPVVVVPILLGAVLSLWACQADQRGVRLGPALVKRSQMLMGTLVFVTAVAPQAETARRAAAAGLSEIRRLEELLSTWIPTSDLSRVNAAAGRASVTVSLETLDLLRQAQEVAVLTEGGFNIAIGPAVEAWGFPETPRLPSADELRSVRPLVDLSRIQLDEKARTVSLALEGMRVDVGGIGKGFAADLAAEVMREAGATAGVVALSGDIKTFGRNPDGERFLFGIQDPRDEGMVLGRLELEDEAVSTAGDYQRFFVQDGVRYHHILDPETLLPVRHCRSVTVVAKTGVLADGLDTGIFVMGPERGMALVERLEGVEAVIVDDSGQVLISSGLKERVELLEGKYKVKR